MRSISFKLVGAFILLILLGTISNGIIIPGVISTFFNYYLTFTGNTMADALVPQLQAYYEENGTWDGVNQVFINNSLLMTDTNPNGGPGQNMGPMMGNPDRKMDIRFTLVDNNGNIVVDNMRGPIQPPPPPQSEIKNYSIIVNEYTVGTLLVYGNPKDPLSPGFSFIEATTRATWITTLFTAILAVILGIVIFRQIVSPLRQMTQAAQLITKGDLSQRVLVTSKDEVGTLANTFNQMAETLEQNQLLRRNLTADIAHELRTPISIIQANLEAMLDGVLQASPNEIASLRDETSLLARLVDDLRLLSLAEAGQLKLVFSPIQMESLIQKATEPFFSQAEDQNIKITVHTAAGLPEVEVDTDRIEMVIRNLLNNAFRYTQPGGEISVSTQKNPVNPRQILVEVTDSGCGIGVEDLPFVFDRFYRADHSRSRASGGTGIGLAIVKQLVEAHGGQVSVESPVFEKNGTVFGTRFRFTMNMNGKKLHS